MFFNVLTKEMTALFDRVAARAQKKDYFDLHEIMTRIPAERLKTVLLEKYGEQRVNFYHILKSLVYFDDAEKEFDPRMLSAVAWEDVKRYFLDHESEIRAAFLA